MKLDAILRQPEGKTLEFKRDLSSPRPIVRTLVAFANSAGGSLVIGVDDAGRVAGIADPIEEAERLANIVADSVEPQLLPEIAVLPWRRTQVLVAQVAPSALRPHYVKSEGAERGTYVRLGPTNRQADAALVGEMRRRSEQLAFDEQPIPSLNYEALDFVVASQLFAPLRKLRRADLATLGLATKYQGKLVPTVGGVLLFGVDRLRHFPDAWIQAGCFAGIDKGAPLVDQRELRGYPVQALSEAISFVERNTRHGVEIGRLTRRDLHSVPPVALREALVNAVVHADYAQRGAPIRLTVFEDRIEIENPGILLPGLTIDEMREGVSRLRNRVIGRAFKELGLIEQWGSGVQRMTAACIAAGLPEPEFEEIGLRFRTRIRLAAVAPSSVAPADQDVLAFIDVDRGRSTAEVAAHLGRTTRSTQQRLAKLQQAGMVVAVGTGPRDPRRRWHPGPNAPAGRKPRSA
ncbi:ATP-binding protein [Ramlibacter sp.]|uniref:ATP-binding protein n=1 Tax=Ramlibacter sp. TaxID=1917967 RepID=UPI003D117DF9